MRFYTDSDGSQKRYYTINPPAVDAALFTGRASDGRQVISAFYSGPRHLGDEPAVADLVAHWFSLEGDFLGYERHPIAQGLAQQPLLAWMADLEVTKGPVEVKKFACWTGLYILDPVVDTDANDAEYDFEDAQEKGIFHLYLRGESYIVSGDGKCSK